MAPLRSLSLSDFLAQLAAKTPAPGGGAVAGATGATAAALARMAVAYSLGKKNLAEHQPALQQADAALARAAEIMLELADEDAAAYALVQELQKLPETDPRRLRELPAAQEAALAVPRSALAACCDLLRLIEPLVPITNRHLRSDLAIAAILAESAARAAQWNVAVNLPSVSDDARRTQIQTECHELVTQARARQARIDAGCA